jgi:hypothetical protein
MARRQHYRHSPTGVLFPEVELLISRSKDVFPGIYPSNNKSSPFKVFESMTRKSRKTRPTGYKKEPG